MVLDLQMVRKAQQRKLGYRPSLRRSCWLSLWARAREVAEVRVRVAVWSVSSSPSSWCASALECLLACPRSRPGDDWLYLLQENPLTYLHTNLNTGQLSSLVVCSWRPPTIICSTHLLWLASSRAWLASLREVSSMPTGRVALQRPQEQVLMASLCHTIDKLVITFNHPNFNQRQRKSLTSEHLGKIWKDQYLQSFEYPDCQYVHSLHVPEICMNSSTIISSLVRTNSINKHTKIV